MCAACGHEFHAGRCFALKGMAQCLCRKGKCDGIAHADRPVDYRKRAPVAADHGRDPVRRGLYSGFDAATVAAIDRVPGGRAALESMPADIQIAFMVPGAGGPCPCGCGEGNDGG